MTGSHVDETRVLIFRTRTMSFHDKSTTIFSRRARTVLRHVGRSSPDTRSACVFFFSRPRTINNTNTIRTTHKAYCLDSVQKTPCSLERARTCTRYRVIFFISKSFSPVIIRIYIYGFSNDSSKSTPQHTYTIPSNKKNILARLRLKSARVFASQKPERQTKKNIYICMTICLKISVRQKKSK